MFLDLRFLLEILLRWMGQPETAAERSGGHRRQVREERWTGNRSYD